MNRFQKELNKRGYLTEKQLPCIPYETQKGIFIEAIRIDAERCSITMVTNVITQSIYFERDFSINGETQEWKS